MGNENLKFTKSKNFEKPDYVNEAMETLKFTEDIMKKIAMFTMGTRGDVQPYIYLAQELNKNGDDTLLG